MKKNIQEELDDFFSEDLLLRTPDISLLNDDIFEDYNDCEPDEEIPTIDDIEFNKLLKKIGCNEKNYNFDDDVIDIELERAKLKLEREQLENEKEAFERQKKEWEALRKLSEESFQAEKEDFARKMKIEREKLHLETRKMFSSYGCSSTLFDDYEN